MTRGRAIRHADCIEPCSLSLSLSLARARARFIRALLGSIPPRYAISILHNVFSLSLSFFPFLSTSLGRGPRWRKREESRRALLAS